MVALGIVVSFLVVLLNMHHHGDGAHARDRYSEGAGFSRFDVVRMLLGETLMLTLMGTGLGIALTFLTQAILKQTNPGLTILISPAWIFSATRARIRGSRCGSGLPRAPRRQLRPGRRSPLTNRPRRPNRYGLSFWLLPLKTHLTKGCSVGGKLIISKSILVEPRRVTPPSRPRVERLTSQEFGIGCTGK